MLPPPPPWPFLSWTSATIASVRCRETACAAGRPRALPGDRAPTRSDWSALSSRWTARIDEQLAELERLRLGLAECIGCGCLSLDRCALANPDDRAGRLGPGPRHWLADPV